MNYNSAAGQPEFYQTRMKLNVKDASAQNLISAKLFLSEG